MNINIKKVSELNKHEFKEINDLILDNFNNSRLNTYENVITILNSSKDIIGVVGLYYINKYLSINQLCIHYTHRNQGLASLLLKYIQEIYKETPIILYIDKNYINTDYLYNFYLKRGFKEISYLKTFNLIYERDKEILMIIEK